MWTLEAYVSYLRILLLSEGLSQVLARSDASFSVLALPLPASSLSISAALPLPQSSSLVSISQQMQGVCICFLELKLVLSRGHTFLQTFESALSDVKFILKHLPHTQEYLLERHR